jgi:hypothetical protein
MYPNHLVPEDVAETAEMAAATERRYLYWRREFEWALSHGALGPVTASPAPNSGLLIDGFASQFGLTFTLPGGSDDPQQLLRRETFSLARRIAPMMLAGASVCIDLSTAVSSFGSVQSLVSQLLENFPDALACTGIKADKLWFSCAGDDCDLSALKELCDEPALGRPGLLVRLTDEFLLSICEPVLGNEDALAQWNCITETAHQDSDTVLILETTTRPACDLCTIERANSVLPLSRFEIAEESAWLTLQIDMQKLELHEPGSPMLGLRRLLRAGLRMADNLVDQLAWSSCRLRQDATLNRRLVIQVTGIGELVDGSGWDPSEFATAEAINRRLALLKRMMIRESLRLARRRGPFPALQVDGLVETLTRRFGSETALSFVRQRGLRHRHLLALSPFAMFPTCAARYPPLDYMHLLGGLRFADTVAMYGDESRRCLTLEQYRRLLRMTWAQARNR